MNMSALLNMLAVPAHTGPITVVLSEANSNTEARISFNIKGFITLCLFFPRVLGQKTQRNLR